MKIFTNFALQTILMYDKFDDSINVELLVKRYENSLKEGRIEYFDVDEFEEIADYFFNKNDISKALKVIDNALSLHYHDENLIIKKAQLYSYSAKPELALKILNSEKLYNSTNPDVLVLYGLIYSQLNRSEDALAMFFEALEKADEEEKDYIYLSIAFEYENLGLIEKAVKYLKLCLKANPENESALFELSICYETLGAISESIKFFNSFLDENPYSDSAWYCLGLAYENIEKYEEAIKAYDYAITVNEGLFAAYFGKANCYVSLEKYDEAIKVYNEILNFEGPDANIYINIAEAYEKMEKFSQAKYYYKKALDLDNTLDEAWAGLACIEDHMQNNEEALFNIKTALKYNNDEPDYWYIYANILSKKELYKEAEIAYFNVLSYSPEDEDAWIELALLQYHHLDPNSAITTLKNAIEHLPENTKITYLLGGMLYINGKKTEALRFLRESLLNDYSNYKFLLENFPTLKNYNEIIDLIDLYK